VLGGARVLFGSTEVAVTAATGATEAGPLLGLWGVGSLLGGIAATRAGGGARTGAGLALLLAALAGGHMTLPAGMGSTAALAAGLVRAGTMIAPTCATPYAMVEAAAPGGAVTEAFAWMTTAAALGTSAGAAVAGVVADAAGPAATMLVAGVAGLAVAAVAAARAHTVTPAPVAA
jgi:predicted MFS family arabinose efflux permease